MSLLPALQDRNSVSVHSVWNSEDSVLMVGMAQVTLLVVCSLFL